MRWGGAGLGAWSHLRDVGSSVCSGLRTLQCSARLLCMVSGINLLMSCCLEELLKGLGCLCLTCGPNDCRSYDRDANSPVPVLNNVITTLLFVSGRQLSCCFWSVDFGLLDIAPV